MATKMYSSTISHVDNAAFRAWGRDFSDALEDIGLVRTDDTGQIDWDTVSKPATPGNPSGYEVWRFDDDLQTDAPIYLKFEYGTGSNHSMPSIWVTVGRGSDGSGTITGIILARATVSRATNLSNNAATSFFSHSPGFLGIAGNCSGIADVTFGPLLISRTTDDSGEPTAEGVTVTAFWGSLRFACYHYGTNNLITVNGASFCLVPGYISSSMTADGPQVFNHAFPFPEVRTSLHSVTVIGSEIPPWSTFEATPVGLTPRTFIALHQAVAGQHVAGSSSSIYALAMLWE